MKKYTAFFDFDNTITPFDVLDDILERFSKNSEWVDLEEKWEDGLIGSRECLEGQIKGIRIDKRTLDNYLSGIKVDDYFKKIKALFAARGIELVILSDNFDYILNRILTKNGLDNLKIYSNKLKFTKEGLRPVFPFVNKDCLKCAHCKKSSLTSNINNGELKVYVGDGLSDVCSSKCADLVFAKEALLEHYRDNKLSCIPYKSLKDVYEYFRSEP